MSLFKEFQSRQIQKKANNFIKSLENKSEKEVEKAYLETPEFENNEIVLSYLFFNYPSLIRIMPIEFQKSRINSNLSMFNKGSEEVKKQLISSWISGNKFFMNASNIGLSEEEIKEYLKEYFKQPNDIPLLFMDDLSRVISVLSECDLKQTENIIKSIKDKFNDKQWEFIIKVNPIFIKYASQEVQKENSEDEKYAMYLSGEARGKYIESQIEKIEDNLELLKEASLHAYRLPHHQWMGKRELRLFRHPLQQTRGALRLSGFREAGLQRLLETLQPEPRLSRDGRAQGGDLDRV